MRPPIVTHTRTGWTRQAISDGSGRWQIVPTDGSDVRLVRFDTGEVGQPERAVVITGAPLPSWAVKWLESANAKAMHRARRAFGAMVERAEWDESDRIFGDTR